MFWRNLTQRYIQVMPMFTFRVKMCVKQTDSNVTRLMIGVWSIALYSAVS